MWDCKPTKNNLGGCCKNTNWKQNRIFTDEQLTHVTSRETPCCHVHISSRTARGGQGKWDPRPRRTATRCTRFVARPVPITLFVRPFCGQSLRRLCWHTWQHPSFERTTTTSPKAIQFRGTIYHIRRANVMWGRRGRAAVVASQALTFSSITLLCGWQLHQRPASALATAHRCAHELIAL